MATVTWPLVAFTLFLPFETAALMFDPQSLNVNRLAAALGAEVRGVKLANVDGDGAETILKLLVEHKVLFFPGQNLSVDQHVSFGAHFGELQGHPHYKNPINDHDKIFELVASRGGVADEWHSDVTFRPNPALFSILNMVTCPEVGGDTMWSNPELAYEELSAPLRDLCDGLTAVHNAAPHGRPDVMTVHPVVRTHPVTGKKTLFVNEHFTRRIVELSHEESEHLLGYFFKWIATPRFTVRYRWKAGTIAMWDNRCTQHMVLNDFNAERLIQRVTVMGDTPEGDAPKWAPFMHPGHASDTSRHDELLMQCLSRQDAPD